MEKKKVTEERFLQALAEHEDEVYHLQLKAWQMPILHGLISLAADHPGVNDKGWPTKQLITQIGWWCREKFSDWGFSPEEVEYLDQMRKAAQGDITGG